MNVYECTIRMKIKLIYSGSISSYLIPNTVMANLDIVDTIVETETEANNWRNDLLTQNADYYALYPALGEKYWLENYAKQLFLKKMPKEEHSLLAVYSYDYTVSTVVVSKLIVQERLLVHPLKESTNIPKKVLISTGAGVIADRISTRDTLITDVESSLNIDYSKFLYFKTLTQFISNPLWDTVTAAKEFTKFREEAVDKLRDCDALVVIKDTGLDQVDYRLMKYAQSSGIPIFVIISGTASASDLATSEWSKRYYRIYSIQELLYMLYYDSSTKKQSFDPNNQPMWLMTITWKQAQPAEYVPEKLIGKELVAWMKEYFQIHQNTTFSYLVFTMNTDLKTEADIENMLAQVPDRLKTELIDLLASRKITYKYYTIPYRSYDTFQEAYDEYIQMKENSLFNAEHFKKLTEIHLKEKYNLILDMDKDDIDVAFSQSYTINSKDLYLKPIYNETSDITTGEHKVKRIYLSTIITKDFKKYTEAIIKRLTAYGYEIVLPVIFSSSIFNRKTKEPTERAQIDRSIMKYARHQLDFSDALLIPNDAIASNTELNFETYAEVVYYNNVNPDKPIISFNTITPVDWETEGIKDLVGYNLNGNIDLINTYV